MYPSNIFYMIDKKCNERCSKCDHWQSESIRNVKASEVSAFVSNLPHAKELCIVGGEPLLYKKDILHIIKALPKVRVVIITNGILATKAFLESLKDTFSHIVFSIDTIDETFWEFVRGTKSYKKVMDNFHNAIAILDKSQISVQSVLSKQTQKYIPDVKAMCERYGIYHSTQNYIGDFNGKWDAVENTQESSDIPCKAYISNLSILPNGNIYTCFQQNLIPHCQKPIGHITQNARDILHGSYTHFVRTQMQQCSLNCKVLTCNQ